MSYIIKSTLQRNGKLYFKGDLAPEMPEKELQLLAENGVIEVGEITSEKQIVTDPPSVDKINAPSIKWSKPQLTQYAVTHGFKVDATATKQEILDLIESKNNESVKA